jgi:hypothetical protein
VRAHEWRPIAGTRPVVRRHACPCTSAGMDSHPYEIRWINSPRHVRRADTLTLVWELAAPASGFLVVEAAAVLARFTHDRRIASAFRETVVAPGLVGTVSCDLQVPPDMSLGLHEASLLAIVNGALVQRSYMVDVLPRDASTSRTRIPDSTTRTRSRCRTPGGPT